MNNTTTHSPVPQRFRGAWKTYRLGEIASFFKGSGNLLKTDLSLNAKRRCIHYGELFTTYGECITAVLHGTDREGTFFRSLRNDVLMPASDVTPNGLATASCISISDVILGGDILVIRVPEEILNGTFLAYTIRASHNQVMQLVSGTTVFHLYARDMANFRFIAPSVREQNAIVSVLSDLDAAIDTSDALIAKKRAVKHAAMQQLLTGETRLPGFSGEWEMKRVGDLLTYERPDNYIVQSTVYTEYGEIPVLTGNKSFILGYTEEEFGVCHRLPVIVFDDFTTDCKYATFPFKVKSGAIKLLHARNDRVSLRYVYERMQLIRFPVADHKRYYIAEYQHIKLLVPSYEEQVAIAEVLSDMDAEINALERRRDKVRAIKQGMMQELLTGRVRLVKSA